MYGVLGSGEGEKVVVGKQVFGASCGAELWREQVAFSHIPPTLTPLHLAAPYSNTSALLLGLFNASCHSHWSSESRQKPFFSRKLEVVRCSTLVGPGGLHSAVLCLQDELVPRCGRRELASLVSRPVFLRSSFNSADSPQPATLTSLLRPPPIL